MEWITVAWIKKKNELTISWTKLHVRRRVACRSPRLRVRTPDEWFLRPIDTLIDSNQFWNVDTNKDQRDKHNATYFKLKSCFIFGNKWTPFARKLVEVWPPSRWSIAWGDCTTMSSRPTAAATSPARLWRWRFCGRDAPSPSAASSASTESPRARQSECSAPLSRQSSPWSGQAFGPPPAVSADPEPADFKIRLNFKYFFTYLTKSCNHYHYH